ncbi:MAG TPA: hypothetical protein VFV67_09445 [Actinophytocola sp.]|nr:hypothetical protein [Actinophytocola sp.]HEU5470864.1 hypothetical protein [Actinophytocola sp.]
MPEQRDVGAGVAVGHALPDGQPAPGQFGVHHPDLVRRGEDVGRVGVAAQRQRREGRGDHPVDPDVVQPVGEEVRRHGHHHRVLAAGADVGEHVRQAVDPRRGPERLGDQVGGELLPQHRDPRGEAAGVQGAGREGQLKRGQLADQVQPAGDLQRGGRATEQRAVHVEDVQHAHPMPSPLFRVA